MRDNPPGALDNILWNVLFILWNIRGERHGRASGGGEGVGEGGGVGPVYRAFLWVALLHVALISAGFLILAASFQFPEILRESAQTRLALFTQSQGTIVPAYYMMGMTGLTQIALAVLLHRAFAAPQSALLLLALVAGVLGGAFQAMGFLRWPIAIPYLAQAMAHATTPEAQATVALLEGTLNRYAGMVVGSIWAFSAKHSGRSSSGARRWPRACSRPSMAASRSFWAFCCW